MKTLSCTIIILLGCICAVFTACKDDDPIVQLVTPYEKQYGEAAVVWEATHQSLFNFKGNPLYVQVSEESTDEDLAVFNTTRKYLFDKRGHLLIYNPINELADASSGLTRGWGAAGEATRYSYGYDSAGRLTVVTETELGGASVVYELKYGTHTVYVPFPLSFAGLPLFLLKGLVSVEGDNGFKYEFDGEKAVCETNSWMGITRTEYLFRNSYPSMCTKQLIRGDEVLQHEETVYAFGEKGVLLGMTTSARTNDDSDMVQKRSVVYASPWLQVQVTEVTYEAGLAQERTVYTYTEEGFLLSATKSDNEGNTASVHLNAYELDAQGNWASAERAVEGYFNDYWPEGTMNLKQEFSYK